MKKLFLLLVPAMLFAACNNGSIPEDPYTPVHDVTDSEGAQDAIDDKANDRTADGQPITIHFPSLEENAAITIPSGITSENTPEITVQIDNDYDDILFLYDAAGYDGQVNVVVPATSTAAYLIIDLPQADVSIKGSYRQVNAKVAPTSLYVEADCSVTNLNLEAGNAVLYGNVENMTAAAGTTYSTVIGTGKVHSTLAEAMAAANCVGALLPAGTYTDRLTIAKDFSIKSYNNAQVIVSVAAPEELPMPEGAYQGQNPAIYINGAYTVTLDGIIVTTIDTPTTNTRVDGITIDGGANLTLNNVTIQNIISGNALSGGQYGRGVTVYGNSTLTVTNSVFSNNNKDGIHVMSGTATVTGSQFSGTETPVLAQNGIVFMSGTSGSVTGCTFTDFNYTGDQPASAAGILLYGTPQPNVDFSRVESDNTFVNCEGNVTIDPAV